MIEEIRNGVKYKHVSSLIKGYSNEIVEEKEELLYLATELQKDCNLYKLEDYIHIILACSGNADYFVTTDGEIIKNSGLEDAVQFLRAISGGKGDFTEKHKEMPEFSDENVKKNLFGTYKREVIVPYRTV